MKIQFLALLAFVFLVGCMGPDRIAEGKKQLDSEQWESAEKIFAEILEKDSENPEALWGQGKARMQQGKLEAALADLEQVHKLAAEGKAAEENMGKYHFDRGLMRYLTARYQDAIPDFKTAAELNFELGDALAYVGVCKGSLGDDLGALNALTEAVTKVPDNHFAWSSRGFYNSKLGDNKTAIKDLSKAIEIVPDDKVAYLNRGYTYIGMQDFENAKADFKKAIEIDAEYADAHAWLGIALTNSGQSTEALPHLDKAISLKPGDGTFYYYRGTARINAGQTSEGCADLHKAVKLGDMQGMAMINDFCQE